MKIDCSCHTEGYADSHIVICPLHATTPELLELLKLVAEGWQARAEKRLRGMEPLNPWEKEMFGNIKAAIAKAEGR